MARFPVIVGPTAGGKSALAVDVALEFDRRGLGRGEVVSADAFQVFRGMDIGTAKPTPAERRGVLHHLIDILDPAEPFTVHQWLARAEGAVADITSRGGVPVVVGGTHLSIKAFLEGLFEGPGADEALREELRLLAPAERRAELERVDPAAAARIHPNDERRTIRAIEVFRLSGRPISEHQSQWDREDRIRRDCVLVGLDWPANLVNSRINQRVRDMLDRGLVEEVRSLWKAGRLGPNARDALGYSQLVRYLQGEQSLEDAVEAIKVETRRFAKNQRTWLRRLRTTPDSIWLESDAIDGVGNGANHC